MAFRFDYVFVLFLNYVYTYVLNTVIIRIESNKVTLQIPYSFFNLFIITYYVSKNINLIL
jgi:hypothetical protein